MVYFVLEIWWRLYINDLDGSILTISYTPDLPSANLQTRENSFSELAKCTEHLRVVEIRLLIPRSLRRRAISIDSPVDT